MALIYLSKVAVKVKCAVKFVFKMGVIWILWIYVKIVIWISDMNPS